MAMPIEKYATKHIGSDAQAYEVISGNEAKLVIRKSKAKHPYKNGKWFDAKGNRYSLTTEPNSFYDYNF